MSTTLWDSKPRLKSSKSNEQEGWQASEGPERGGSVHNHANVQFKGPLTDFAGRGLKWL